MLSLGIRTLEQREQILAKLRAAAATTAVPDTSVTVIADPGYPPLIETPAVDALAARATAIYAELGKSLGKSGNGGASESAVAQSVGTPALDGLGLVGGDFHTDKEWIDLTSLTPRLYLFTRLLDGNGHQPAQSGDQRIEVKKHTVRPLHLCWRDEQQRQPHQSRKQKTDLGHRPGHEEAQVGLDIGFIVQKPILAEALGIKRRHMRPLHLAPLAARDFARRCATSACNAAQLAKPYSRAISALRIGQPCGRHLGPHGGKTHLGLFAQVIGMGNGGAGVCRCRSWGHLPWRTAVAGNRVKNASISRATSSGLDLNIAVLDILGG